MRITFRSTEMTIMDYLELVRTMYYDAYIDIMSKCIPEIALLQVEHGAQSVYMDNISIKFETIQNKHKYPIEMTYHSDADIKFTGIAPADLLKSLKTMVGTNVVYLPMIVHYTHDIDAHQMVFVINLSVRLVFLYNPNGSKSRYSSQGAHRLLRTYVSLINVYCSQQGLEKFAYVPVTHKNINKRHDDIGDGHCVVACIRFMIDYHRLPHCRAVFKTLHKKKNAILNHDFVNLYKLLGSYIHGQKTK